MKADKMSLFRRMKLANLLCVACGEVIKSQRPYLRPTQYGNLITMSARNLSIGSSKFYLQANQQYEYDPDTDSFKPKKQMNSIDHDKQNRQEQEKSKSSFPSFLKRFLRNLFLLTGGAVWIGVVFVSLFVDVKEEELIQRIQDFDDEVRLLAFYDIGKTKSDLANMMSRDKRDNEINDIHAITNVKQSAFLKIVKWAQEEEVVVETLGAPVHLCGYRAAEKISHMIKSFQHLAEHGMNDHFDFDEKDDSSRNRWTVECVLEGTKGLAVLAIDFRLDTNTDQWLPIDVKITCLDRSRNNLIKKSGSLPAGLNLGQSG